MPTMNAAAFGVPLYLSWHEPDFDRDDVLNLIPGLSASASAPDDPLRVRLGPGPCVQVGKERSNHGTLREALDAATKAVTAHVGLHCPDLCFIHSGAVSTPAGALLLPGRSYAGKSTLVAALLRVGCEYLSDEYAPLDAGGLVHPYPRRLSLRTPNGRAHVSPGELGAQTAAEAMPVAAIVRVQYQPGASLHLKPATAALAALDLIDNALTARQRPAAVLRAASAAAEAAFTARGVRGDADEAAGALLELLGIQCGAWPNP